MAHEVLVENADLDNGVANKEEYHAVCVPGSTRRVLELLGIPRDAVCAELLHILDGGSGGEFSFDETFVEGIVGITSGSAHLEKFPGILVEAWRSSWTRLMPTSGWTINHHRRVRALFTL